MEFVGPTSIDHSDLSSTDAASCQSSKFNAFTDLAQRVSSEADYGVTSAAEFLSESQSLQTCEKHDDTQHIIKTVSI